jgi:hypothetical protein
MQQEQWHIQVCFENDAVVITASGSDPRCPASVRATARGPRARSLLNEIRLEMLYREIDMTWSLHSEDDMYGWHAAVGRAVARRTEEDWVIDHDLP